MKLRYASFRELKSSSGFSDSIRELLQINLDSASGFKQASEQFQDSHSLATFAALSSARFQQAVELQALLGNQEAPLTQDILTAPIGRTVLDWHPAFGTTDDAILKRAERGEEYVQAKYAAVLCKLGMKHDASLLQRQYEQVQAAHQLVSQLRRQGQGG